MRKGKNLGRRIGQKEKVRRERSFFFLLNFTRGIVVEIEEKRREKRQ